MSNQHDHGSYIVNYNGAKGSELTIIHKDGNYQVIPYVHCMRTEFIVHVGIILHFSFGRITLSGRNLSELGLKIGKRTIDAIREQHTHERDVPEDQPYIANILVEERAG